MREDYPKAILSENPVGSAEFHSEVYQELRKLAACKLAGEAAKEPGISIAQSSVHGHLHAACLFRRIADERNSEVRFGSTVIRERSRL